MSYHASDHQILMREVPNHQSCPAESATDGLLTIDAPQATTTTHNRAKDRAVGIAMLVTARLISTLIGVLNSVKQWRSPEGAACGSTAMSPGDPVATSIPTVRLNGTAATAQPFNALRLFACQSFGLHSMA